MAAEIITKRCSTCKQSKPLSEFYKERSKKDGRTADCKICRLKHQKEYSQTEKGKAVLRKGHSRYSKTNKNRANQKRYFQGKKGKAAQKRYLQSEKGKVTKKRYKIHHPERVAARKAVQSAIKAGQLPRPDSLQCSCGEPAKEYHHWHGYEPEHFLDVIPVCIKCHNKTILRAV